MFSNIWTMGHTIVRTLTFVEIFKFARYRKIHFQMGELLRPTANQLIVSRYVDYVARPILVFPTPQALYHSLSRVFIVPFSQHMAASFTMSRQGPI